VTQKARKGYFKQLKLKKFPGGACPLTSLGACAFGARFSVNRSTFFLDPRLVMSILQPVNVLMGICVAEKLPKTRNLLPG